MAVTDHYIRFEIVDAVEEAPRGLLAHLHGERLRVGVVRDDVVRVAISRGGCSTSRRRSRCAWTRSHAR